MADYGAFMDSFVKSGTQSTVNSEEYLDNNSISPQFEDLSRQKSLNIPSIKTENVDNLMSKPVDIKKQLSQSFQGSNSLSFSGSISKPQSRKNSIAPVRSNGSDDDDNEDEDGQGNERKRRDNINEKIQELLTMVPVEFFQENPSIPQGQLNENSSNEAAIAAAVKNSGTKDGKPNKGQILTKSVEYIQYLQNLIDENNRKEVELVMKLKNLELKNNKGSDQNATTGIGHTSGEKALGEIGVGPLSEEYFKQVLLNSSHQRRSSIG